MDLAKENPRIVAVIAFWGAVVFSGWTIWESWNAAHILAVAKRQQVAQATIVSLGAWDHGQTHNYTFEVGRQKFYGNSLAPMRETYKSGQAVPVYYDPRNMTTSSLVAFSSNPLSNAFSIIMGVCFAGAALIHGVRMWRRSPAST